MDKLNKYLHRITAKHNGTVIYSTNSTYYHICGRIIRVSDHVGRNSDGSISIIYDAACSNNFIVHAHNSGMISVVNYENLKKIIKSFTILPAMIGILGSTGDYSNNDKTVFGYNIIEFSKNQRNKINKIVKTLEANKITKNRMCV